METILNYLIRSILVSGLLLGYYQLLLRNRKTHRFNRVFLLSTLMASLVLPLIRLNWLSWHSGNGRPLEIMMTRVAAHPPGNPGFPWVTAVAALVLAISLFLLLLLAVRVRAVYRLRHRYGAEPMEDCYLIRVQDRRAPFSFFNNLFWQQGADIDDPVHRRIMDHELAHIRGRHSCDTLFAQSVAAVFWLNPFHWLIRRELAMVHEFIADEASLVSGDSEGFARMLLQAYDDGRYLDPSHRFFHSPIKRRLTMIARNGRPARWGMLLTLPVLMIVMTLSCSKDEVVQKPPPPPPAPPAKVQAVQMDYMLKVQLDSTAAEAIKDGRYKGSPVVVEGNQTALLSIKGKQDLDKATRIVAVPARPQAPRIVPDGRQVYQVTYVGKGGQVNVGRIIPDGKQTSGVTVTGKTDPPVPDH